MNTRRDLAAAEEIERRRGGRAGARCGRDGARSDDGAHRPARSRSRRTSCSTLLSPRGRDRARRGLRDPSVHAARATRRSRRAPSVGPHCDVDGRADRRARPRRPVRAAAARARVLEEDVRVGNFVETKNTVLAQGRQGAAPRLPRRRGDRRGLEHRRRRHHLQLRRGEEAPHDDRRAAPSSAATSQLVAPVTVGDGAYVGAGTTITEDVPDGRPRAVPRSRRSTTRAGWRGARRRRAGRMRRP